MHLKIHRYNILKFKLEYKRIALKYSTFRCNYIALYIVAVMTLRNRIDWIDLSVEQQHVHK